jgi:hypothetical protein
MLTLFATIAAMPWLQGFEPAAVADHPTRGVVDELAEWQPIDDQCVAGKYGGLELTSELAPAAGDERVLGSFAQGVVVLGADGHLIARSQAFTCQGSADELVSLAAGDAWIGSPVLALAATSGGKNENTTWLTLYRVAGKGELAPIWSGEVEHHQGHVTTSAVVLVYPGGLLYQSPSGVTQIWRFDPDQHRYINRGAFGPSV